MKKSLLITILIIISVCVLALTGCGGGAPIQKKLGNSAPWIDYINEKEVSIYDVVNTNGDTVNNGTYTIEIARIDGENVKVADKDLNNFKGFLATASLVMENGDTIDTKVATETTMRVIIAESSSKIGETTKSYVADYGKKSVDYVVNVNGEEVTKDSIKIKDFYSKPFTDNTMLYLMARSIPTGPVQFGIYMPNFDNSKLDQVIINRKTANEDFELNGVTYKTSCIELAFNRTFPGIGAPIKAYVSDSSIKGLEVVEKNAEGAVLKPILKIIEGNTTYTLTSTLRSAR